MNNKHFYLPLALLTAFVVLALPTDMWAQKKRVMTATGTGLYRNAPIFDEALYKSVQWRSIGPFRGGRSAAVTGVPGKANLFYFGSVGGGVWRTKDGGQTWENISDGFFGGSIGAVAVSEYDHNVIYVGGAAGSVPGASLPSPFSLHSLRSVLRHLPAVSVTALAVIPASLVDMLRHVSLGVRACP